MHQWVLQGVLQVEHMFGRITLGVWTMDKGQTTLMVLSATIHIPY